MNLQLYEETLNTVETLIADQPFVVEINGPKTANTAVVMVHGFGVKHDSRGLFTDIEVSNQLNYLFFRPELYIINKFGIAAIPFSLQVQRINKVISFLKDNFKLKKLVFIGHSQGNLVISLARPKDSKIFLLSPPVEFEKFIKTKGWQKKGSHLEIYGKSKLVRSDLTIEVNPKFWEEFKKIDSNKLYINLNKTNKVQIVYPSNDLELGSKIVENNIPNITIDGANHDFNNSSREVLIKFIFTELKKYKSIY